MLNENIGIQARLVRQAAGAGQRPLQLDLTLMDLAHAQRATAEAFVQSIFIKAYGARLNSFYPLLMTMTDPDGGYAAVAGIRPAGGEALFSEYYLKAPVEQVLGIDRMKVVEIGNLAPSSAGQARWLICTLTAFLTGAGFSHVVFTAVPRLYNAFRRMGLPLTKHADARQEQLPAGQADDWGTYYGCRPAVYSGDIRVGAHAFRDIMTIDPDLFAISQRAFAAGQAFTNGRSHTSHG